MTQNHVLILYQRRFPLDRVTSFSEKIRYFVGGFCSFFPFFLQSPAGLVTQMTRLNRKRLCEDDNKPKAGEHFNFKYTKKTVRENGNINVPRHS